MEVALEDPKRAWGRGRADPCIESSFQQSLLQLPNWTPLTPASSLGPALGITVVTMEKRGGLTLSFWAAVSDGHDRSRYFQRVIDGETQALKRIEKSHSPKHAFPHTHSPLSFSSKSKVMALGMISHTSPLFFSFSNIPVPHPPTPTLFMYITELCTFTRTQRNNNPSTRPLREQIQEYLRASKFPVTAKWKFPKLCPCDAKITHHSSPTLVPVQFAITTCCYSRAKVRVLGRWQEVRELWMRTFLC